MTYKNFDLNLNINETIDTFLNGKKLRQSNVENLLRRLRGAVKIKVFTYVLTQSNPHWNKLKVLSNGKGGGSKNVFLLFKGPGSFK